MRLTEAEAVYRRAIGFKPDDHKAYGGLAAVLKEQGRFRESLEMSRQHHDRESKYLELLKKEGGWSTFTVRPPGYFLPEGKPATSGEWAVRKAELVMKLNARLPDVAVGRSTPADLQETLDLAKVAFLRKWYRTSARLYDSVLTNPDLAKPWFRYDAVRSAVLAGCWEGEDPAPATAAERARLRKRALEWAAADLAGWSRFVDKPPGLRGAARRTLWEWRYHPHLVGVRDEAELRKLPEAEQSDWRKFWAEMAKVQEQLEPRPGWPSP